MTKRIGKLVLLLLVLCIGWALGSFFPLSITGLLPRDSKSTNVYKITRVLNLMENDWFFAKDVDEIDTTLTDQALKGITTNDVDPHTEYLTAQELERFTQAINRNFVGIGVEFMQDASGQHIITKLFLDGPAEKAGVQVGDVIHAVDGTVVDNKTNQEIVELVKGEEGTVVQMDFLRNGKTVSLKIKRGQVASTTQYEVLDGNIGYLQIEQFGNSTAKETKSALEALQAQGAKSLIIDLRNDGGGYIEALEGVVDLFLPKNTAFIKRVYANGKEETMTTNGGTVQGVGPIVILVNENTASAAEAFTLAMKEGRKDVTIVGKTTYGKGTVQVQQIFSDGSALKYTNSKWESPSGVWINATGIKPDIEVDMPHVAGKSSAPLEKDTQFKIDQVDTHIGDAQEFLSFLGYPTDRTDGYFSQATQEALQTFQSAQALPVTGVLDADTYNELVIQVVIKMQTDRSSDTQLQRAMEVFHG